MKRLSLIASAAIAVAVPWSASSLRAQDDQPTSKQELARTKFKELTERMQKLHTELAKTAPKDSEILGTGIQWIQEAKIQESMAQVKQLLEKEEWDPALAQMQSVRKDLTKLLELLQNRNKDLSELLAEISRLEKLRNKVDALAKEQGERKEETVRAEQLQQFLEDVKKAQEQVEQLTEEQKELRQETSKQGLKSEGKALEGLSRKQALLKETAQKLTNKIAELEEKAEQVKGNGGRAGHKTAGNSSGGGGGGGGGGGAGASSAGGAVGNMAKAEKKLADMTPEPAVRDQDKAIEDLEQAAKELKNLADAASRELLKLPLEVLAKKQEDLKHATDTLSKEMEAEEAKRPGKPPPPGKTKVQQSIPKQKAAAGQLKEYKPSKAKQQQQDAKEDLEEARDELDEALAQLRQQLQDAVLRALEERFTAMLAKQRDLSANTKVLDKTRATILTSDGNLPTSLVEKIQAVASGEHTLGNEAGEALKLLDEEGTTAVFPEITRELRDQLLRVAKDLRGNATGNMVQQTQADIEETLALLINALRKTIERKEGC